MSDNLYTPNDIIVEELTLINYRGDELDISAIYEVFDVQYDIFNTSICGSIYLVDTNGLRQNFPIIGEEKIRMRFRTEKRIAPVEHILAVYSITDVVEHNSSTSMYVLNYASPEFLKNKSMTISTAFTNESIKEVVENCLFEKLESKRELLFDEAANKISYIAHKQRPFGIINAMLPRAISKDTDSSAYVFFEGVAGFYFYTVESLLKSEPITYNFTSKEQTSYQDTFLSVSLYEIEKSNDVFDNLQHGMYGNTVLAFDPITLSVQKQTFDYFNDEDYKKLNFAEGKNPDYRMGTQDFNYKSTMGKFKFMLKDEKSSRYNLRMTKLLQIENSIIVNVEVPCNTALECGCVIDLKVPFQSEDDTDLFLKGKYLVTSLRHIVTGKTAVSCMRLSKDSYNNSHENETDETQKVIAGIRK